MPKKITNPKGINWTCSIEELNELTIPRGTSGKKNIAWDYFGNLYRKFPEKPKKQLLKRGYCFCMKCLSDAKSETNSSFNIQGFRQNVNAERLTKHLKVSHNIPNDTTKHKTPEKIRNANKKNAISVPLPEKFRLVFGVELKDTEECEWIYKFLLERGIINKEDGSTENSETIEPHLLDKIYKAVETDVKKHIACDNDTVPCCYITLDTWNLSKNMCITECITYTCHYIRDFKMQHFTLLTEIVTPANAAPQTQIQQIKKVANEFGLTTLLLRPFLSENCIGCAFHKLLMIDGIQSVPDAQKLKEKVYDAVTMLRQRTSNVDKECNEIEQKIMYTVHNLSLYVVQDMLIGNARTSNEPCPTRWHTLIGNARTSNEPCPTRWHTFLVILESLGSQLDPLNRLLERANFHRLFEVCEWRLLLQMVQFLKSFEGAIELLTTNDDSKPSINLKTLFKMEIVSALKDDDPNFLKPIKDVQEQMMEGLKTRFKWSDEEIVGSLLDPRFQNLIEINTELAERNKTKDAFLTEIITKHEIAPTSSNTVLTADFYNADPLLTRAKKYSQPISKKSLIEIECFLYLFKFQAENVEGDILKFWKSISKEFPLMSRYAMSLFGRPTTCSPSKRIFYDTGLILNEKRSLFKLLDLDKIVFISENYKFSKKNQ